MTNKTSVTIGIPAYNEAGNIGKLLQALLSQDYRGLILKNIIVVSDHSTDNTDKIVKSFRNKSIKLISNQKRSGQMFSQNRIMDVTSSDVLVLLNADIIPADKLLIRSLVKPIQKNLQIGIVGGDTISKKGRTFFENILISGREFRKDIYKNINQASNIYLCHGRVRAFNRMFYKKFRFSDDLPEDAYSFLKCKSLGFKFYFEPKAKIIFRSPESFKEHMKQSQRYQQGKYNLQKYFDEKSLRQAYYIPKKLIFEKMAVFFAENPFMFICYFIVLLLSRINIKSEKLANYSLWDISTSSKNI